MQHVKNSPFCTAPSNFSEADITSEQNFLGIQPRDTPYEEHKSRDNYGRQDCEVYASDLVVENQVHYPTNNGHKASDIVTCQ